MSIRAALAVADGMYQGLVVSACPGNLRHQRTHRPGGTKRPRAHPATLGNYIDDYIFSLDILRVVSYYKDMESIQQTPTTDFDALLSVTVISVEPIDEGYAVAVEITDVEYELDDDDEGSAISELRAAGFDAEWRDDYEPQENGRTRVTIFAIPREKCEDCAVRF